MNCGTPSRCWRAGELVGVWADRTLDLKPTACHRSRLLGGPRPASRRRCMVRFRQGDAATAVLGVGVCYSTWNVAPGLPRPQTSGQGPRRLVAGHVGDPTWQDDESGQEKRSRRSLPPNPESTCMAASGPRVWLSDAPQPGDDRAVWPGSSAESNKSMPSTEARVWPIRGTKTRSCRLLALWPFRSEGTMAVGWWLPGPIPVFGAGSVSV